MVFIIFISVLRYIHGKSRRFSKKFRILYWPVAKYITSMYIIYKTNTENIYCSTSSPTRNKSTKEGTREGMGDKHFKSHNEILLKEKR